MRKLVLTLLLVVSSSYAVSSDCSYAVRQSDKALANVERLMQSQNMCALSKASKKAMNLMRVAQDSCPNRTSLNNSLRDMTEIYQITTSRCR